jgi:hypothetical protein
MFWGGLKLYFAKYHYLEDFGVGWEGSIKVDLKEI